MKVRIPSINVRRYEIKLKPYHLFFKYFCTLYNIIYPGEVYYNKINIKVNEKIIDKCPLSTSKAFPLSSNSANKLKGDFYTFSLFEITVLATSRFILPSFISMIPSVF